MLSEAVLTNYEPITQSSGIRAAARYEAQRAIGVVMLAFSTDPVARWVYPDPAEYLRYFPTFIWAFGGGAFELGSAYITPDFGGAALWLPPGAKPDDEALIALFGHTTSDEVQDDLFPLLEEMGAWHPDEPHWYLPMIGVDGWMQNRGIGSALMSHALERCDADGLPAYLESSNPRNIPLYERFGFEVKGVIQKGASAPLYPMLRKAR